MIDILNLNFASTDKDPRPKWPDGIPAHTRYITHIFEQYDIEEALFTNGEGFPVTTLRNTAIKSGIQEVLWIYQDMSNKLSDAHKRGITWWDEFDIGDGTIGQRYGATVRKYDLMDNLLHSLHINPYGRRHIMDLYQYADLKSGPGLHPCAFSTSWSVRDDNGTLFLDMFLHQRSSDVLMANAINKAQYVALQMMVARDVGMKVGKFSHFVDNYHVYDRHLPAAHELLEREPLKENVWFRIKDDAPTRFWDMSVDDFEIFNPASSRKLSAPLELAI